MSSNKSAKNVMAMTADSVGVDLLQALVQEIKLLPDVWPKMSKAKQDDVIERLRKRVITNVQMATHLIASDGRVTVVAELEQITVKDGIKAVLTMSKNDPNRHGLIDCQGKTVLIALADAEAHMGEVAAVRGEADQRAMDLGHEYDPNGDGKGMDGTEPGPGDDVSDARILSLGDGPLDSEKEQAYADGYAAAEAGKPKAECPMFRHELVSEWTAGWTAWHEEQPTDEDQAQAA
jgi:ribosome modulation factor